MRSGPLVLASSAGIHTIDWLACSRKIAVMGAKTLLARGLRGCVQCGRSASATIAERRGFMIQLELQCCCQTYSSRGLLGKERRQHQFLLKSCCCRPEILQSTDLLCHKQGLLLASLLKQIVPVSREASIPLTDINACSVTDEACMTVPCSVTGMLGDRQAVRPCRAQTFFKATLDPLRQPASMTLTQLSHYESLKYCQSKGRMQA